MISIISSVGKNRELGKDNKLIWHFREDMKFFKKMTMNHKVIMGYKTYKSIPNGLPGREIIVVTSRELDGVCTVNGIEPIVDKYKDDVEEIFICGGASVYAQFLPYADRLYLTEIAAEDDMADTYFPKIDRDQWKRKVLTKNSQDDISFKICLYERKII